MTSEAFIGLIMLLILLGAIFVGVPISFTLLFLALAFGWLGLGDTVFNLAYFQTIGMMKEEVLAAVPLFILMGFVTQQAGLMERLFIAFRHLLAPMRGSLYVVVVMTAAVFAMATGIVGAAVTVLGIMASPIMIRSGYDARLSSGAIAAGGGAQPKSAKEARREHPIPHPHIDGLHCLHRLSRCKLVEA
jgi:TRAP-type mannitol/chloroaromatic compound transport system permease large subunit